MEVLMFIVNIIVFIVCLGLIILIHEFGHFIFAKKFKVLCYEFSLGMGPVLLKRKKGETTYALRAVPIGGFVAMAGEDGGREFLYNGKMISLDISDSLVKKIYTYENNEFVTGSVNAFDLDGENMSDLFIDLLADGEVKRYTVARDACYVYTKKEKINELQIAPSEKSFDKKKKIPRVLIIFAGPLMNFVLAFLLFFIVTLFSGKPLDTTTIGNVSATTTALQTGDKIIAIDNTKLERFGEISTLIFNSACTDMSVDIEYERDGSTYHASITPRVDINALGISNLASDATYYSNTALVGHVYGKAVDAGLLEGDIIVSVERMAINNWSDLIKYINNTSLLEINLVVKRGSTEKVLVAPLWSQQVLSSQGVARVDVKLGVSPERGFDFFYLFSNSFSEMGRNGSMIFQTLGALFTSSQVSVSDLSGPIGIFNLLGQVMQGGVLALISFTAFLSINVGIINLLPVPAFDGGRLLFIGIEAVARKKMSSRIEGTINNIFFIVLLLFMLYVTFNDVLRLF